MRGLGIFGVRRDVSDEVFDARRWDSPHDPDSVHVDGMRVRPSLVTLSEPRFDTRSDRDSRSVLIAVSAFSCNYRDKGCFRPMQHLAASRFRVIGSEFAGTVIDVGRSVTNIAREDHVIGQNAYVPSATGGSDRFGGLPTNGASREFMVLPADAVTTVPASMSPVVGAAFGVGSQTAFSMVRRAALNKGATALVFSSASNTSLSLIAALRYAGVTVVATTSSPQHVDAIRALGVHRVVLTERGVLQRSDAAVIALAGQEAGPFDAIFDPHFDLHIERGIELLAPYGRYVTCGFAAQNPGAASSIGLQDVNAETVLRHALLKNLVLLGNCLGEREDLTRALSAYDAGALPQLIDTVHAGDDARQFMARTFSDPDRFGKVVFAYDTSWR
jgi:NADPH:quinone reductase-like Zn-dependent oxidoreductase